MERTREDFEIMFDEMEKVKDILEDEVDWEYSDNVLEELEISMKRLKDVLDEMSDVQKSADEKLQEADYREMQL